MLNCNCSAVLFYLTWLLQKNFSYKSIYNNIWQLFMFVQIFRNTKGFVCFAEIAVRMALALSQRKFFTTKKNKAM